MHKDSIILSKEIGKQLYHETVLDILLGFFKIIRYGLRVARCGERA